jgi:hypothetical protein
MAGKGGRPKGGAAITKNYDQSSLNVNDDLVDDDSEVNDEKDSIRDAIGDMLTGNLHNLQKWLEEIGDKDPLKALTIFKDFTEYVLPKQQRTDSKGDETAPVIINLSTASSMPKSIEEKEEKYIKPKKSVIDEILS